MFHVGIVGLGFMGMIHYLAYQRLRGVKVHAVCEVDPSAAAATGGRSRAISARPAS